MPSSPLTLNTAATSNGVLLYVSSEVQGLTGSCGDPCTGEGAVSMRFAAPQSGIGLDITKTNGGTVTLQFFEATGAAFTPVVLNLSGNTVWTFTSEAGYSIGGVTITNDDSFGVAYDNLRLNPAPVPLPAAAWLFGSGLLGLVGVARRKTQRTA